MAKHVVFRQKKCMKKTTTSDAMKRVILDVNVQRSRMTYQGANTIVDDKMVVITMVVHSSPAPKAKAIEKTNNANRGAHFGWC